MLNKVMLIGHVGADPEIRKTQQGKPIANFRLATSERWKDASGEKQERTHWHTCVCFNEKLSEVIERYVKKGSKIYIEGSLQTRKWQDQQGNDRYSTEVVLQAFNGTIVLLDSKESGSGYMKPESPDAYGSSSSSTSSTRAGGSSLSRPSNGKPLYDKPLDDEIPF